MVQPYTHIKKKGKKKGVYQDHNTLLSSLWRYKQQHTAG